MSVQFGRWNFDGQPIAPEYIEKVRSTLGPYGPDGSAVYADNGLSILYHAFCTTPESRREKQPHASPSGIVLTWDGRLDNRADLIRELQGPLDSSPTDVSIVAAAFENWGHDCFAKLIGDWALSICNPHDRTLLLARDPLGAKHLYFMFDKEQITWSTILDPLVLFSGKTFEICEEYVAGWFASNAAAQLTPYVGVYAVPPSSSVLLRPGMQGVRHSSTKYWEFDPGKRVRHGHDEEYAEHFRTLFNTAVRRRLRSDKPILAELSGGLDSTSIVCVADQLLAHKQAECPRLDTISWYDDSYDHLEPQSNELHWIAKVEEKRGRTGCHINARELKAAETGPRKTFWAAFDGDHFAATPFPRVSDSSDQHFQRYAACVKSGGHRVTFSGIGGGEFTGGFVPDPTPELQDLLTRARFVRLAHQLSAWAARMRKPRLPLLRTAISGFFSPSLDAEEIDMRAVPWFRKGFVRRNRSALRCYVPSRAHFFGPLPSFQENFARINMVRRLMSRYCLSPELLREIRYPFLDRDLLEFLLAVPREQIVGVGKRRFLAKRAMTGILPEEVLNRRPKDFNPPPEPPKEASTREDFLRWPELNHHLLTASLGIVDPDGFLRVLQKARRKEQVLTSSLDLTLMIEFWLRHLMAHGVLASPTSSEPQFVSPPLQVNGLERPPDPTV